MPISLAPSVCDFSRASLRATDNDNHKLLTNQNLLRPKALNTFAILRASENDNQEHSSAYNDGQFGRDEKAAPQLPAFGETGRQQWIATPDASLNGACKEADGILAARQLQNNSTTDIQDAVMLGENEAEAIDCHYNKATFIYEEPINADNQYKGAILPNLTADEAHAGQLFDCMDPSSGFGSDGNRHTFSLTKESYD